MGKFRIGLRAVVYPEGQWWIPHGLEMDLVAEGKTPRAAIKDLIDLSLFQIQVAQEEGNLESIFRPAPPNIWAMFASAAELNVPKRLKAPVTRFEARELEFAR